MFSDDAFWCNISTGQNKVCSLKKSVFIGQSGTAHSYCVYGINIQFLFPIQQSI